MSDQTSSPTTVPQRNPLVLAAGVFLLIVAGAIVLFGSNLFGAGTPDTPVLDQVRDFDDAPPVIGQIPSSSLGTLRAGDRAPDFTLADLDGNPVSLADFRGRPVIINFWATWCAPCRLEMPGLQSVYEAREDEGLVILAINRNEDPALVRDFFVEEFGLTFTPLLDNGEGVTTLFGVGQFMPTTFFVNGDGAIAVVHRGLMTEGQINDFLAQTVSSG